MIGLCAISTSLTQSPVGGIICGPVAKLLGTGVSLPVYTSWLSHLLWALGQVISNYLKLSILIVKAEVITLPTSKCHGEDEMGSSMETAYNRPWHIVGIISVC